jgi:hypothetical protein
MKISRPFLVSISANLLLVGTVGALLAWIPGSRMAPVISAAPPIVKLFQWSQIDSPDADTFLANLRAIGCPEQTIRDLVLAEADRQSNGALVNSAQKPESETLAFDHQSAAKAANGRRWSAQTVRELLADKVAQIDARAQVGTPKTAGVSAAQDQVAVSPSDGETSKSGIVTYSAPSLGQPGSEAVNGTAEAPAATGNASSSGGLVAAQSALPGTSASGVTNSNGAPVDSSSDSSLSSNDRFNPIVEKFLALNGTGVLPNLEKTAMSEKKTLVQVVEEIQNETAGNQ